MYKRGFEFGFVWLFVIVVGTIIILLAIYASWRFTENEKVIYDTRVAAELESILSPLETNLEDGKYYRIKLPDETKMILECDTRGTFGEQSLKLSVRSGVGEEWSHFGIPRRFSGKYVFANRTIEGNEINVFVVPFSMPYKIGSLIIIYTKDYCLVSPPNFVKEKIESLGLRKVNITNNIRNCPRESVKVCFDSISNCNVMIIPDRDGKIGEVRYGFTRHDYYDNLIYAAIFSDSTNYQCNLFRLRKRAAELARVYSAKTEIIGTRGCTSGLGQSLNVYYSNLINEQINFRSIINEAKTIENANGALACRLF